MKNYTYPHKTIEISEEWLLILEKLDKQWERNERRNTRRHFSTTVYDKESRYQKIEDTETFDIPSYDEDCLIVEKNQKQSEKFEIAKSKLSTNQKELYKLYYQQGLTTYKIAALKGVSRPAISQQLATLKKKIRKFS